MRVILGMAGGAILRRAFELPVNMAACTSHCAMLAIQMEGKLRVVHICGLPTFGRVAGLALITQ